MAGRPVNRNNSYVRGNLAFDYDYLERERQRRAERERRAEERRTYEPRRERAPQPRRKAAAQPRHRERVRVSPLVLLGFAASAVMVVALLGSYAEMTAVSHDVVTMQSELAALEHEHVDLVGRYERTFDLAAIKEAAENAGMAKPSSSQIYYIDLSEPDGVMLYPQGSGNMLSRAITSMGQETAALLEYFK